MTSPQAALPADPFFETIHDSQWNACVGIQGNEQNYVDGYIEAALELAAAVLDKKLVASRDTLAMPILYNGRHALELSLKFAINRLHAIGSIANRQILVALAECRSRLERVGEAGMLHEIRPPFLTREHEDRQGAPKQERAATTGFGPTSGTLRRLSSTAG